MKTKTVRRTYYNKSKGGLVTKVYTYNINRSKAPVIVSSSGVIYKKRAEAYLNTLTYSQRNVAEKWMETKSKNKERITTRSVEAHLQSSGRQRMLINAGYTLNEACVELNTTAENFLNEKNWDNNIYTNAAGISFMFEFTYEGSVWKRV